MEVALYLSHGCDQIFLPVMGSKGVEMRINPLQPVPQYPQPNNRDSKPNITYKLFDADGEVRVGDVVRFNNKPCFVERIAELITIVTMDERKYTLNVQAHQIRCVLQKERSDGQSA